jgi:hypothetical protein
MSPITQTIIDLMASRMNDEDTLITYAELEQMTDKPLLVIRHFIYTARKHIRDDHGKWFDCYRGIGFRVVPDEDLPNCGKANRSRARNLHRETIKTLAIADPTKQSAEARRHTMLERSVAELGMAATAPRSIARIEQEVARAHNQLSLEQQVAAIKDALSSRHAPRSAEVKADGTKDTSSGTE